MEQSQTSLRAFFFRQINNDFSTFCSYSSLAELKCIRSRNEEDRSYAQDLAKSQRYSLQLERQLRELLQSPQGSGQLLNRFFFIKRAANQSNATIPKFCMSEVMHVKIVEIDHTTGQTSPAIVIVFCVIWINGMNKFFYRAGEKFIQFTIELRSFKRWTWKVQVWKSTAAGPIRIGKCKYDNQKKSGRL